MTIAAGFTCSDGAILCADTLLSANYRQRGPKLWTWTGAHGLAVGVTGAGNYVLLRLAKEAIFRRLNATKGRLQPPTFVKHSVIEPVIASIHEDHVDKASDWDRANGYGLSLLVVIRDRGKARLYETDRRACSEVRSFSCVGSGAPVGNYVGSNLFSSALPVDWAQVSAAYLIQQTKAFGEDCGGDTNLVVMPNAGAPIEADATRIVQLEKYGTVIHEGVGRVLMAATDLAGDDLFKSAREFHSTINEARNEILKARAGQYEEVEQVAIYLPPRPRSRPAEVQPARTRPKLGRKGRTP